MNSVTVLYYPDERDLKVWAEMIVRSGLPQKLMPPFDDDWAGKMQRAYALTSMHPEKDALDKAAARIFYRIIKNHQLVDGNKRSAIFCTYLFVYKNNYDLDIPADALYRIAKSVAKSKRNQEALIQETAEMFSRYLASIEATSK